ncbi:MAG: hypothetical protein AAGA48_15785 [Myxococcota bacterium]
MPTDPFSHTRNALHHAVQVPSGLAATHLPRDDQDKYANLGWDPQLRALVSRGVGRQNDVAAGLRFADGTWIVVRRGVVVAERALAGSTLMRARTWLQGVVAGLEIDDRELVPAQYELPNHPAGEGHPLADLDEAVLKQFDEWFALSHNVLTGLRSQEPRASEVRCWPHHFDLATLITLDADKNPEEARSIGIGMTPGDGHIHQPYLYVAPWPRPANPTIVTLSRGRWHVDGFVAAVMTIPQPSEPEMSAFIGEAVAHSHTLLASTSEA